MTKNFVRGQKSKLSDLTPSQDLIVGLDAQAPGSPVFDISCFGVDADNKLSDDRYFVYFNQKESPEGEISSLGARDGDQEAFRVDLSLLPQKVRKLVFVVTLDGAGTMSQVSRGHVRLVVNGSEMARFDFTGSDFGEEKAIIVAEIYHKDIWRFAAVGQGFNGGLSALLEHFGGQEIEEAAPAPPPPAPKVNISKVTLDKRGDKQTVDLSKGAAGRPIHVNLNWDTGGGKKGIFGFGGGTPDLDLGCMLRLKDGTRGVIQPLGGKFGAKDRPPYIYLDKDDRSGAAADGENLYLYRPDTIDLVMVFALVYEGTSDFTAVNGRLEITDASGGEVSIRLNNPDRNRTFCAICTMRGVGGAVDIIKEEQYFRDHREADAHYGFGFRWARGSK